MPRLRIGPKRPPRLYLAEWRDKAGISGEHLGLRFDPPVEKGQISKWEAAARTGKISYSVVAEYAAALGRSYQDMERHPDHGPSLDAMAASLKPPARDALIASIIAMGGRKAS